jgi:hypothetical protein
MDVGNSHVLSKRRFVWGIALAGTSSIPLIILFFIAFRGIQPEKATGLAAIAGGLAEGYSTLGLLLTFLLPVAAIVVLRKSWSGANSTRKMFSVLITIWSAFMLLIYGLGAWLFFSGLPHLRGGQ